MRRLRAVGSGCFSGVHFARRFCKRQTTAGSPPPRATGVGVLAAGAAGLPVVGPPRGRRVRPSPSSSRASSLFGTPELGNVGCVRALCGLQEREVERGGCGLTWVRASGQRRAVSWFPRRTGTSRPLSFVRSHVAVHGSYKPSLHICCWGKPEHSPGDPEHGQGTSGASGFRASGPRLGLVRAMYWGQVAGANLMRPLPPPKKTRQKP